LAFFNQRIKIKKASPQADLFIFKIEEF